MNQILLLIVVYFIASIPFGLLISKAFGKKDLRTLGSGNIGATNAFRVNGKLVGILTLIFDFSKGFFPIFLIKHYQPTENLGCFVLMCVIGHIFSLWLKFKGGKGVAVAFGVLFAMQFTLGIIAASIWILTFKFYKTSSISSLSSLFIATIAAFFLINFFDAICLLFSLLLIIYKHKSNIKALYTGKENPLW